MTKKYQFSVDEINKFNSNRSRQVSITEIAKEYCKEKKMTYSDSIRRQISKLCKSENKELSSNKPKAENIEVIYNKCRGRTLEKSKYYLVTWEQNSTPLHNQLLKNILAYKEFLNAELIVILGRYKNPTSTFSDEIHENWNSETQPYWSVDRHDIHKYLTILSDVKIQPTAKNPLVGLESITGISSTLVGHPKLHLKTLPILEGHPKKIMLTTGAITVPNYTDSKEGKHGESKHKLGFTIVEVKDEEVFFIRQVEASSNGDFNDIHHVVREGVVSRNEKAKALVWGDTHFPNTRQDIINKSLEIVDRLNIEIEVHHDVIDGESVNNHIVNNPFLKEQRKLRGHSDIIMELEKTVGFLQASSTRKLIVQSNHNDRLDRWLLTNDWREDLENAEIYLKLCLAKLSNKMKKGVFAYVIEEIYKIRAERVKCLDYDDSFIVGGFELGHHGHIGANGSRGSIEQFRRMPTRVIIGHSHQPCRIDDALSVGTSTPLREGYNRGASSWMNAHIVIHENNTAQHLLFVDGEYTTL